MEVLYSLVDLLFINFTNQPFIIKFPFIAHAQNIRCMPCPAYMHVELTESARASRPQHGHGVQ